jgi:hypothetical protein
MSSGTGDKGGFSSLVSSAGEVRDILKEIENNKAMKELAYEAGAAAS